jgi:hypothetical protein
MPYHRLEFNMKKVHDLVKMQNLIVDLYWEYDRMSSSGQNSLDKIAKIMKVPTENEIKQIPKETI